MLDFIRIACAVPPVQVGDVKKNTADICDRIREADEKKCDLVLFPELALTGYTCADLFFQETLLQASLQGLQEIAAFSAAYPRITAVVGLPALWFPRARCWDLCPRPFCPTTMNSTKAAGSPLPEICKKIR